MSIRFKILFILALGFLALTSTVFFFTRQHVENAFSSFEIEVVDASAEIVRETYSSELDTLLRYAEEMARSQNLKNLLDRPANDAAALLRGVEMLENRLSFLAITNARGEIIFSREADFADNRLKETSENLTGFIRKDNRLRIHHHVDSRIRGLILLDDAPMLTVSVPILPDREGGLIQGAVILGRSWERSDFSRLASHIGMTVFYQQTDGPLSEDMKTFFQTTGGVVGRQKTQLLGDQAIATYITMADIYEKTALVVRLTKQRQAYNAAVTCAYQIAKFSLFTGLALFLAAIILIETTVIYRLRSLLNQVKDLKSRDRMSEAVITVRGKDEVGKIAHGIRFLLDAMKTNRFRWMRAEKRLQELLEFSPMGILLAKPETQKLYRINDAALKMTGYAKKSLTGKKVDSVFLSIDGRRDFSEITTKMEDDIQEVTAQIKCKGGDSLAVTLRAGYIRQTDGDLMLFAFTPLENGGSTT